MCVGENRMKKTQHLWPQFGKDLCHLQQPQQPQLSDKFVPALDLYLFIIHLNQQRKLLQKETPHQLSKTL